MNAHLLREELPGLFHGLVLALSLKDWRIDLKEARLEGFVRAEVDYRAEYQTATIVVDLDQVEDLDALRRTLRHELLHLVIADVEVFADIAEEFVNDPKAHAVMREARRQAVERMVRSLERTLDGSMAEKGLPHPGARAIG